MNTNKDFEKISSKIIKDNPRQKSRIGAFFAESSPEFITFANEISEVFNNKVFRNEEEWNRAVDSYKETCKELLREQIYFQKNRSYRYSKLEQVKGHIYDDNKKMQEYMYGLLLSYLFWPNQYKILEFYKSTIKNRKFNNYLEIGPGHGLFAFFCNRYTNADIDLIDISNESLIITKNILKAFGVEKETRINYTCTDFLNLTNMGKKYEFITMGEVIEHVERPEDFLNKSCDLLAENGEIFISTCINSPAVDHIYQFKSVDEVRSIFYSSGLILKDEVILPVDDIPPEQWEETLTGINYAALLQKVEVN